MRRTTCTSYCRPNVVRKFMLQWFRMPVREFNCAVTCRASINSLFLTRCVQLYTLQPVVQPVGWTMQMSAAERRLSGPARTLVTCYLMLMGYVAVSFECPSRASVDPACSWTCWLTVPPRRSVVACSTRWQSANWRSSAWLSLDNFNHLTLIT